MREIKFRVFIKYGYTEEDLKNPDMAEEIRETGLGFIDIPDLIDFRGDEVRVKYDLDWYEGDKFKLMQYTGMTDKNGDKIYEGDILCREYEYTDIDGTPEIMVGIGAVKFDEKSGCFIVDESKNESDSLSDWLEEKVCIIGNIYKNPELLDRGFINAKT